MAHKSDGPEERAFMNNSSADEFMLFVHNLPIEIQEDGIREIFSHYGKITALFYRWNCSWACVTFSSFREAESAIKDLHNVPPLRLQVKLSREKKSNKGQFTNTVIPLQTLVPQTPNTHGSVCAEREKTNDVTGKGNPLDKIREVLYTPGSEIPKHTVNDDLLYPYLTDSSAYNPYEHTEPYSSTNTLWTRGQMTITQDGRRHVSKGRGYTLYEIPDPSPDVQDQIDKVYETRSSGFYEYGKDMLQDGIGNCLKCSKVSKLTCEKCLGFYCSKNCQRADWPQHKTECQAIPALVTAANAMTMSPTTRSPLQIPLRRPRRLPNSLVNQRTVDAFIKSDIVSPETDGLRCSEDLSVNQSNVAKEDNDYKPVEVNIKNNSEITTPKRSESQTSTIFPFKNEAKKDSCGSPNDKVQWRKRLDSVGSAGSGKSKRSENQDVHALPLKNQEQRNSSGSPNGKDSLRQRIDSVGSAGSGKSKRSEDQKQQKVPFKNRSANSDIKQHNFSIEDVTKMEEEIAFQKHTFLSKSKYTKVRVIVQLNDRAFWVQKVEDEEALTMLMVDLQVEAEKSPKVQPVIGGLYGVQYEGMWHRASVISINPTTINYIDYGNDEIVTTEDFREINALKSIPRLSARIRLSEKAYAKYRNLKYEDQLSVKMISIDQDAVINVEVQNENEITPEQTTNTNNISTLQQQVQSTLNANTIQVNVKAQDSVQLNLKASPSSNISNIPTKVRSVLSTVSVGDLGSLEINKELSTNTFSIIFIPNNSVNDIIKIGEQLSTECEQMKEHSIEKSRIEDLICGLASDGYWYRGYISGHGVPVKMVLIDDARIMAVSKTVPCPKDYLNICAYGAVCKIADTKCKLAIGDQCEFKVTACKGTEEKVEVEIEISAKDKVVHAIVKSWALVLEQRGILFAELRTGSEVCLTAYRSHHHLFARSLETTEVERYNRVMQSVAKYAQTVPFLQEPPAVGEMLISQYIDQNYYRALVTKVEKEKIGITYVDFGNTEITNIAKLKPLSDDLKELQSCTAKIILKDIPQDVPMTQEISDVLGDLVGRETPLVCTFTGVPSKDGVLLKLPSGESVNDMINELLVPTWKKPEEEKTCFMVNDLKVVSLGKAGEVVEAFILHIIEEGHKYVMCPLDIDLITHINDIMPRAMTEYCESTENYIPRDKELCLALYQTGWFRAVCLRRNETADTSTVLFIDFGNVESVNHKNIRLMPKDFMTPNALGTICSVINLAPTNNDQYSTNIYKRISELIVENTIIRIKIVTADEEDGVCDIEIPSVHATLIEEGLI